jgi:hypothetical protein
MDDKLEAGLDTLDGYMTDQAWIVDIEGIVTLCQKAPVRA